MAVVVAEARVLVVQAVEIMALQEIQTVPAEVVLPVTVAHKLLVAQQDLISAVRQMQLPEVLVKAVMAAEEMVVVLAHQAVGPVAEVVAVTTAVAVADLQVVAVVQAVAAEAVMHLLVQQQRALAQPRVMLLILNVVMQEMPV